VIYQGQSFKTSISGSNAAQLTYLGPGEEQGPQ
jgi:hypothetical protein